MSHDRGCYKCGRDIWEYDRCPDSDCVKKGLREAMDAISSKVANEWKDKVEAMDKQSKRVPRVYVVQYQTKRGPDGRVPKYDLAPAEDYGELIYLLDETHSPFRLGPVMEALRAGLADMRPGDYLLPIGNPVFIGLSAAVAADNQETLVFLIWSAREQRYIAVDANVDLHSNCI